MIMYYILDANYILNNHPYYEIYTGKVLEADPNNPDLPYEFIQGEVSE